MGGGPMWTESTTSVGCGERMSKNGEKLRPDQTVDKTSEPGGGNHR